MEATRIARSDGTSGASFGNDADGTAAYTIGQITSIGNGNSDTSFTSFDAVGRVTSSQEQTGGFTCPLGYCKTQYINSAGLLPTAP